MCYLSSVVILFDSLITDHITSFRDGPLLVVASGRDTISVASAIKRLASKNVFVVQVSYFCCLLAQSLGSYWYLILYSWQTILVLFVRIFKIETTLFS